MGGFFSGEGSFWNSSKDSFDWSDLIGPALQAATSLGGQVYGLNAQKEVASDAAKQKALDQYYQLQLELAKMQMGGGGGGGGGGGARTGMTDAEKVAAQQNARQMNISALNNWVASMQNVRR